MLKELRKKSRDSLVAAFSDSVYVSMYLVFVASVIGISLGLKRRYKDQLIPRFVSSNLPALRAPSEQITWEDFDQLVRKASPQVSSSRPDLALASSVVDRVDVYDDSVVIRLKSTWEGLQEQRYIGFYPGRERQYETGVTRSLSPSAVESKDSIREDPKALERTWSGLKLINNGARIVAVDDQGVTPETSSLASAKRGRWLSISSRGRVQLSDNHSSLISHLPARGNELREGLRAQNTKLAVAPDWASRLCALLDEVPKRLGSTSSPAHKQITQLNSDGSGCHCKWEGEQFIELEKVNEPFSGGTHQDVSKYLTSKQLATPPTRCIATPCETNASFVTLSSGVSSRDLSGPLSGDHLVGVSSPTLLMDVVGPTELAGDGRAYSKRDKASLYGIAGDSAKASDGGPHRTMFTQQMSHLVDAVLDSSEPSQLVYTLLIEADEKGDKPLSSKVLDRCFDGSFDREEAAALLDEGWEEVLSLVNEALSTIVAKPSIVSIEPRPMSGYNHPGLSRREIQRHLSWFLAKNRFRLSEAADQALLLEKEVSLSMSPSLQVRTECTGQALLNHAIGGRPLRRGEDLDQASGHLFKMSHSDNRVQGAKESVDMDERGRPISAQDLHRHELGARTPSPTKRGQTPPRTPVELPVAELGYEMISFTGLGDLRALLAELGVEVEEEALDQLSMPEPAYLGPAVARNRAGTEVATWQGKELAQWIVTAMRGRAIDAAIARGDLSRAPESLTEQRAMPQRGTLFGNNRLSYPVTGSALLPERQATLLGKREILRGDGATRDDRLAGLRPALAAAPLASEGVPISHDNVRGGKAPRRTRRGLEEAVCDQPMRTRQMSNDLLVNGVGPMPRDPSYDPLLGQNANEDLQEMDHPCNPALFVKASPLFDEGREILSLSTEEWRSVFKTLIAQALEDQVGLKQIRLLLPSLAVIEGAPRRDLIAAMLLPKEKDHHQVGLGGWWSSIPEGRSLSPIRSLPVGAAREWRSPLTAQEYESVAQLIGQNKRFVGEIEHMPAPGNGGGFAPSPLRGAERTSSLEWVNGQWSNEHAFQGPLKRESSTQRTRRSIGSELLSHNLPGSQVAAIDSASRAPLALGGYQKRLTSFVQTHPLKRRASTIAEAERLNRTGVLAGIGESEIGPRLGQRRPVFRQLWEPVTSQSWMMLYQFCFVFWALELAKDYYRRCGKEFILYIVDLLTALGFNAKRIIEDLGLAESPMRIITNGRRRFADIAGIDSILPQLGEVVWFLRSSGRGGQVPTGLLLVGPPGTGKTFLVQAIAGEAKVPVIVQSASSFNDPSQNESGTQMLRNLFDKARQLAPCILFIDEIDTLAVARPHITGDPMEKDGLLESINHNALGGDGDIDTQKGGVQTVQPDRAAPELEPYSSLYPSPGLTDESMIDGNEDDPPKDNAPQFRDGDEYLPVDPALIEVLESHNELRRSRQQRLALLMQFLMEMDGIRSRRGVVVIGATNRPAVLDPAFTRPGRFERVVCLQLPGKHKRIEILKLYTKQLGVVNPMKGHSSLDKTWQYLSNRTAGLSAAHLASAMNQSAIRAILLGTAHTIETIEHGINAVARRSFEGIPSNTAGQANTQLQDNRVDCRWIAYQLPTSDAVNWWETLSLKGAEDKMPKAWAGGDRRASDGQSIRNGRRDGRLPGVDDDIDKSFMLSSSAPWAGAPKATERAIAGEGLVSLQGRRIKLLLERELNALKEINPLRRPGRFVEGTSNSMVGANDEKGERATRHEAILLSRSAYYQAGKAILHWALPLHPPASFLPLQPEPFTRFSSELGMLLASSSETIPIEPYRRIVLETRLIGLYAGKASELLALDSLDSTRSDLGVEELTFAGRIADRMVDSWYLYSSRLMLQAMSLASVNTDRHEIDDPVLLDMLRYLAEENEHEIQRATKLALRYQQPAPPSWWQDQVVSEEALMERADAEWYRIHLPDPEESERNIDWVAPEDNYHAAGINRMQDLAHRVNKRRPVSQKIEQRHNPLKAGHSGEPIARIRSATTWNDLYLMNRDYLYDSLINTCFSKAFGALDGRRELLDYLSDHLAKHGLLREYEIGHIAPLFNLERTTMAETIAFTESAGGQPPKLNNEPIQERDKTKGEADEVALAKQPPAWARLSGEPAKKDAKTKEAYQIGSTGVAVSPHRTSDQQGRRRLPIQELPDPLQLAQEEWSLRWGRKISRFIDFDFVKPLYLRKPKRQ